MSPRRLTEQPGSAFVAVPGADLREVLCHEETRVVGNDNTVVLQKVRLQAPASPVRAHYVRATVKVRRYADGSHAPLSALLRRAGPRVCGMESG